MIFRQGDVLIKKIDQLPDGLKKITGNILVHGESTGHAHRLEEGQILEDRLKNMYVMVANDTRIVHEEHKPIKLEKGVYAIIRQREYTSGDMTKIVVD